jgi:predicted XRE-type DNA-binding protein
MTYDPTADLAQAWLATAELGAISVQADYWSEIRLKALRSLRGQGFSLDRIAAAVGVSKTRVAQLVNSDAPAVQASRTASVTQRARSGGTQLPS